MSALDAEAIDACRAFIAAHGATRLATRTVAGVRTALGLAQGHVPLLVDYTREDREAKGLRKLVARATAPPPVPYTVLEAAQSDALLLLTGESGCGKSSALRHLGLELAAAIAGDARWLPAPQGRAVVRNDAGEIVVERWDGPAAVPLWLSVERPASLQELLRTDVPMGRLLLEGGPTGEVLLMIDHAENLGEGGPGLLQEAAALAQARPGLRVIVAADADAVHAWTVPPAWARRRVVGLIDAQRRLLGDLLRPSAEPATWVSAASEVCCHAGFLTLALENGAPWPSTPIEAVDRWLGEASRRNGIPVDSLVALGADAYEGDAVASGPIGGIEAGDLHRLQQPFIQRHLAALRLSRSAPAVIAARHAANPLKWGAPVRIAAGRIAGRAGSALDSFLSALVGHAVPGADEQAVVTAAAILASLPAGRVDSAVHAAVQAGLVRIVEHGRLSTASRRDAGRALAREGDPRDLEALLPVAGGAFTMGSVVHPNSAPAHAVTLEAFWIGRYPVVNGLYRQFIEATGRVWRSRDGLLAERANSPAVDLSWHDARACCEWLTIRWRAVGRIGAEQVVRLPTEAEWERAARGVRVEDGLVFPWPGAWQPDHENSEEAGFNDTCAVGLFPLGRSPEGCDDMAGQVWEWTSTLWGTDMATPDFKYPYVPSDGRENSAAPADVRRVLRGACFLSPQEKANCVYRGSLEPDGFWRGNGFRVAVGRV